MTQAGRSSFLVVGLLAVVAAGLLAAGGPVAAQGGTATGNVTDFVFSIPAVPSKAEWAVTKLTVPEGSRMALVYNSSKAALPHDIQVCKAGTAPATCAGQDGPHELASTAAVAIPTDSPPAPTGTFLLPKEGLIYVCSVHPEMVGTITAGAFTGTGAAAHGESITHVGVHFLAYWVGVISFAVLFVVYGASFFLFKHGETPQTTDQRDRPDWEQRRTIMGLPEYVWILVGLAVLALAVAIFFQIMLSGF